MAIKFYDEIVNWLKWLAVMRQRKSGECNQIVAVCHTMQIGEKCVQCVPNRKTIFDRKT